MKMKTEQLLDQSQKITSLEKDLTKNGIEKSGCNNSQDKEDDLDASYKKAEKRHRNKRAEYDRKFKIIVHPFNLYRVSLVIFVVFILTRYLGLWLKNSILGAISKDAWIFLTYAGTALLTHIITKYIDNHYKE